MNKNRGRKAQQLVEFMLVAPFIIIILGILTEYAYALNVNMTLYQGLKDVTSSIYSEIKPGMSIDSIRSRASLDLTSYLASNNAPTDPENKIKVGIAMQGNTAVFMASYTYIPAFTLPSAFFKIMPDKFNFFATVAVPTSFLNGNSNYSTGIKSSDLDGVWGASSFTKQDDFINFKNGIMKKDDAINGGRNSMLFPFPDLNTPTTYYLVKWDGTYNNCLFDSTSGLVAGSDCGVNNGASFAKYLSDNNYYNVIFIHDEESTGKDISTLPGYWNPSGASDLTPSSVQGVLKRSLNLTSLSSSKSIGNYDNLVVKNYNSLVSSSNNYSIMNFGSIVFAYTSFDDISKAFGATPKEKTYDFSQ